jgi:energy-coupling factor transporter ATP-binding protein EcfA2
MTLPEIATILRDAKEKIILIFGFNAIGKTQLSVALKNATKAEDGTHAGVYYNAYSEDLFFWNNDEDNNGADVRLSVVPSSLNKFHPLLTEDNVRDKLAPYKPKFAFRLNSYEEDPAKGIESVSFFMPIPNPAVEQPSIKISRGEERIFVWCFFLALFEVEGWADEQPHHFFIDDPVSSLDDHNIFITATTLYDLIDSHFENRKIIITTHHIGLFSVLADWLARGEKSKKYEEVTWICTLSEKSGSLLLEGCRNEVMLYHLRLLQVLYMAADSKDVRAYHFALLRQVLENVGSFLGAGNFSYTLQQIGIQKPADIANIVNTLSHKKVYYYESDELSSFDLGVFYEVIEALRDKFKFRLHMPVPVLAAPAPTP